jgi:hypothetical protein
MGVLGRWIRGRGGVYGGGWGDYTNVYTKDGIQKTIYKVGSDEKDSGDGTTRKWHVFTYVQYV